MSPELSLEHIETLEIFRPESEELRPVEKLWWCMSTSTSSESFRLTEGGRSRLPVFSRVLFID